MLSLLQTKLQDPKPRLILRDHPMAKARACEKNVPLRMLKISSPESLEFTHESDDLVSESFPITQSLSPLLYWTPAIWTPHFWKFPIVFNWIHLPYDRLSPTDRVIKSMKPLSRPTISSSDESNLDLGIFWRACGFYDSRSAGIGLRPRVLWAPAFEGN